MVELRTDGTVIGASPTAHYTCSTIRVPAGGQLYLYSDGIYELPKSDGTVLQLEEFIALLGNPSEKGESEIDRVLGFSQSLMNGAPFVDDVSILEIAFK